MHFDDRIQKVFHFSFQLSSLVGGFPVGTTTFTHKMSLTVTRDWKNHSRSLNRPSKNRSDICPSSVAVVVVLVQLILSKVTAVGVTPCGHVRQTIVICYDSMANFII